MSAATLYDNTGGATQVSDGPIVGVSEPALRIPAADYLTTGDVVSGDAGDAGNLPAFAIETWFRTPSIGTQQIIAQGPNAHVPVPNRQWTFYLLATGALKFDFVDSTNTNHSLTGSKILPTNQWLHLVATYGANAQRIYINGAQDASGLASGTPWPDLIAGSADMRVGASTTTYAMDYAEFAFYRYELPASRVLAHYQAGVLRGFPIQNSDDRIRAVLDSIDSVIPRSLVGFLPAEIVPRYMVGQAPLDLIRESMVAETVEGGFFVTAGGTFLGLGQLHRASGYYATVQATFGDAGGTEIPYLELELDYSDSFIVNDWSLTREGSSRDPGVPQTNADATSISRYGHRPQTIVGIAATQDSYLGGLVGLLIDKYKNPFQRVTAITFDTVDKDVAAAVLKRELGDKITVKRTTPGGGSRISQDVWIQKIDVSGSNDGGPWKIRWAVSPL